MTQLSLFSGDNIPHVQRSPKKEAKLKKKQENIKYSIFEHTIFPDGENLENIWPPKKQMEALKRYIFYVRKAFFGWGEKPRFPKAVDFCNQLLKCLEAHELMEANDSLVIKEFLKEEIIKARKLYNAVASQIHGKQRYAEWLEPLYYLVYFDDGVRKYHTVDSKLYKPLFNSDSHGVLWKPYKNEVGATVPYWWVGFGIERIGSLWMDLVGRTQEETDTRFSTPITKAGNKQGKMVKTHKQNRAIYKRQFVMNMPL